MTRTTPAAMAVATETRGRLPKGAADRFYGHGILGLTFAGGDILAFRRFPASSVGPPYTSVWHRDPAGDWSLHTDAPSEWTCARYFDGGFTRVVEAEIDLGWTGGRGLALSVPEHGIDWAVRLDSSLAVRLAALLLRIAPPRSPTPEAPRTVPAIAAALLGGGPLRLRGRTPNGQTFAFRPRRLWRVSASAATVAGRDLGPLVTLPRPATLGDLVIPSRGLYAIGDWQFLPTSEIPGPRALTPGS